LGTSRAALAQIYPVTGHHQTDRADRRCWEQGWHVGGWIPSHRRVDPEVRPRPVV